MSSWKATLPCSRAEADRLKDDIAEFARMDTPPVLMTSEVDPSRPDHWRLDAYFDREPNKTDLELLQSLVPSAKGAVPEIEAIKDQDWVTLSQQGLEPIHAGRFFVHTPAYRERIPAGTIPFEVDAGRAFGTGQHETTTGCLLALDSLKRQGARFSDVADLGTGTGLLAFAAMRLWPAARTVASDIDPVAIEVAAENAGINDIPLGRAPGRLELIVAAGLDHARLEARAPYDLIIANILAGPLVEMSHAIAGAVEPGGHLILAGLLDHQQSRVAAAYRRHDMMTLFTIDRGDWPTLVMRKRRRPALPRRAGRR